SRLVKLHAGVVTGGQSIRTDLPRYAQQLIELQVVIAKTARDGSPAGKILLDKRTHDLTLKPLLMIDHVVRDPDRLRDPSGIVHIVQGAAPSLYCLGHALTTCQPALVPKLHRQPDDSVPLCPQHSRDG